MKPAFRLKTSDFRCVSPATACVCDNQENPQLPTPSSRFCEDHATIRTAIDHSYATQHVSRDRVLMGKARPEVKPLSKRKQKVRLQERNAKLVSENGLTMGQRSGQRRLNDAAIRVDVAALTRSRDNAQKAALVARESKNKAMAAKRTAEKAAQSGCGVFLAFVRAFVPGAQPLARPPKQLLPPFRRQK